MSIVTIIKNIKQIHPDYIVLLKVGKFYHCYGKDAYILSYFFNYQLKILETNIYTCGFPVQAMKKIISKLENSKINYMILDRRNNYEVEEKQEFKNLNKYNEVFGKAKEIIKIRIRIKNINTILIQEQKAKEIKIILNDIEKIIQNRRNKMNKNEGRKI